MRVFHEPKVILVTRPTIIAEGVRQVLAEYSTPEQEATWTRDVADTDGDGIPELMGRLCYGAFGTNQGRIGAKSYIANILSGGHGSVMEHACWGFVACRAGRGYTHQMVRHRAGFAFSQESTHFIRYDKEAKGGQEPGFCVAGLPEGSVMDEALAAAQASFDAYANLWRELRDHFPVDAKVKKVVSGTVRQLLPNGAESRLGFTGNARALRHFCELRGNADNTLEVRLVAAQVARIMMAEAPALFQDFRVEDAEDGWPTVSSTFRKV